MRLQLIEAALLYAARFLVDTTLYHDTDHVNVVSPQVAAAQSLDDEGGEVGATVVVDVVSAASVDVISNATAGFTEVREEVALRGSKRLGEWLPGARLRSSHEPDYLSNGGGLSVERRLGSADTTASASLDLTYDRVGRHGTAFADWSRPLWTGAGDVSLTQVLGPRTLLRGVYSLSVQEGYLEKPYRYVPLFDEEGLARAAEDGATLSLTTFDRYRLPEHPPENVPDRRLRHAVGARALRYLSQLDGSLRLDYRFYFDDWGVEAHTGELGLRAALGAWELELDARTHLQSAAWFWRRTYVVSGEGTLPEWRSVDKELAPSIAETLTGRGEWRRGAFAFHAELSGTWVRFQDYLFLDSRTALVLLVGARYDR